jgi:hypothetical protein
MGWGGVQVTGHAAPGHGNGGRIRWASQQARLAPLGRSGLGTIFMPPCSPWRETTWQHCASD